MSERIADDHVAEQIRNLVGAASALLVVATNHWGTRWGAYELTTARRLNKPVVAVRPAEALASRRAALSAVPVHVMRPDQLAAPALIAALRRNGFRPVPS